MHRVLLAAALGLSGCVVVPAFQREHLADPTMAVSPAPLEQQSLEKLERSREGAGGGAGASAGGGCACGN